MATNRREPFEGSQINRGQGASRAPTDSPEAEPQAQQEAYD